MIVTQYFAKLTGIRFGKISLSPLSRCRGVHGQLKVPLVYFINDQKGGLDCTPLYQKVKLTVFIVEVDVDHMVLCKTRKNPQIG